MANVEIKETLSFVRKDPDKLSLTLSSNVSSQLRKGDNFAFSLDYASEGGYLYVDYLQADGVAVKLDRHRKLDGGLGNLNYPARGKQYKVQEPYGREILVSLFSKKQLSIPELKSIEKVSYERDYLSALRSALLSLTNEEREDVYFDVIEIVTQE